MTNHQKSHIKKIALLAGLSVAVVVGAIVFYQHDRPLAQSRPASEKQKVPVSVETPLTTLNSLLKPEPSLKSTTRAQQKQAPASFKNLDDLMARYNGQGWLIRKDGQGRVKRIMGMHLPLGELNPARVVQFAHEVSSVFNLSSSQLATQAELLQDGPTLNQREGVRAFRIQQEFQGYPVLDGSFKVFVNFADVTVTLIEGADLKGIQNQVLEKPALTQTQVQAQAGTKLSGKLQPLGSGQPEVAVSETGIPKLVYRFMLQDGSGGIGPETKEVWLSSKNAKVVRERPLVIMN